MSSASSSAMSSKKSAKKSSGGKGVKEPEVVGGVGYFTRKLLELEERWKTQKQRESAARAQTAEQLRENQREGACEHRADAASDGSSAADGAPAEVGAKQGSLP